MLKRISRDIAIYGSGDLAFRLLGFLVFPIYAHIFSVKEFGTYALVSTSVGLVALFANLGLYSAVQRHYWDGQTPEKARPRLVTTGIVVLLAWSCTLASMLIAMLYPLREVLSANFGISWRIAVIAMLAVVPDQLLQYCLDTLRLHFSPWKFTFLSFLKNLLGIAIGLLLIIAFDAGLEGLFGGALIGAVAALPVALFLIRQDLTRGFDNAMALRLVRFGYPFMFAGLAYWIFGSIDRWMLAELRDTTQLGLYSIAYKFATVVVFLNGAFGQAWSPIALKLRQDHADYRLTYARILSSWFFFLTFTGTAVTLFGSEALRVLTPPEYWPAASSLGLLVMGVVLSGTTQITAIGISLEMKTRLFAFAAWASAVANIGLNFILIPAWGADGAALATFLSYGLLTSLYLFWSQKLHPVPLERAKLLYSLTLLVSITVLSMSLAELHSIYLVLAKVTILALAIAGGIALKIIDVSIIKELVGEKVRA